MFVSLKKHVVLISFAVLSSFAQANDHGGAAPGGDPFVFVINAGNDAFLRFGIILEAATPEASHEISIYKPRIQHEVILLMSGRDVEKLRSLAGKKALANEINDTANRVIHGDRETGIKDVLFTGFLIQ